MSNPVRTCLGCSGRDDHPRHVVDLGGGAVVTFHMDCHVISNDCKVCAAQLEGVGGIDGNPKGDALRAHLQSTGPGATRAGWTAPTESLRAETTKGLSRG